jgi:uncharacterized membrane protein/osmotically-inducible protein OsmY
MAGLGRTFLQGIALGAGLTYLFDPDRGKRRRARMRDQMVHMRNLMQVGGERACRDMTNRLRGIAAGAQSAFGEHRTLDEVLVERVRSKLGRYVSHPGAIEVAADNGRVILSGPILAREVNDLLSAVQSVHGVQETINQLDVHERAEHISALQGGKQPPGEHWDIMQSNWSPATRLLVGATGCGLMANCLARRSPLAVLLGTAGFAMFLRSATNKDMDRLLGLGEGPRGIACQRTINIAAPVDRVYEFVRDFESFPRFMRDVKEVHDLGDGRVRWKLAGPAGTELELVDEITQMIDNEVIAWRAAPGSPVQFEGTAHFQSNPNGGTRVQVRMSYNPPGGVFTHLLASAFGADPESEIEREMMRIKTYLETGKVPHDAAQKQKAPGSSQPLPEQKRF